MIAPMANHTSPDLPHKLLLSIKQAAGRVAIIGVRPTDSNKIKIVPVVIANNGLLQNIVDFTIEVRVTSSVL